MWQQWVNVVLGLWVVVLPFIGLSGAALGWTLAITGFVVAALALWGSQETMEAPLEERRLQHQ